MGGNSDWDDILPELRPDADDLAILEDISKQVIEALKLRHDFDVLDDRGQGIRRLGKPESRFGKRNQTITPTSKFEWSMEVINRQRRAQNLMGRLKNTKLFDVLIHNADGLFGKVDVSNVPNSDKLRVLEGPRTLRDVILPGRPDTLIRVLPNTRVVRQAPSKKTPLRF